MRNQMFHAFREAFINSKKEQPLIRAALQREYERARKEREERKSKTKDKT